MPSALPIKSSKSRFVGHGINIEKFRTETKRPFLIKGKIVSVGRIAPIKNLEKIIKAISRSGNAKQEITLIGASNRPSPYRRLLESQAIAEDVKIIFKNAMPYSEISNELLNYGIFYTGNPRTTDKAAIEAAVTGCFVVSEEQDTLHLVGMDEVFIDKKSTGIPLEEQLSWINSLSSEQDEKYRKIISLSAIARNDVNNTTRKILYGIINA
jgi:glycosyltransferase involved in cell wall biosynthesis